MRITSLSRVVCLGLASGLCSPVLAQDLDALAELSFEQLLHATVDLGNRRGGKRRDLSLVPVDTFYGHELLSTGFWDLSRALQRLSPYVNRPQPSITDGTDHVPPFTLRGMEPDQTLVLVNGKRLHTSALVHLNNSIGRGSQAVDLQTLPVAAVEKVEVLRDGAAAQYGSDAIAGIINIVLKSATGWQFHSQAGVADAGDGEQLALHVSYGQALADTGYWNAGITLLDNQATNRSNPDPRPQYFDGDPRNADPTNQFPINHRFGLPEQQAITFHFNGEWVLAEAWKGYAFGHWQQRDSEAAGFFRRPRDNRNVRSIYPDGFLPLIRPEITDINLGLGISGQTQNAWSWDVSNTFGANQLHYFVHNSLNTSFGNLSPTRFDSGQLRFWQDTLDVNLGKELTPELFLAVGAELRYEHYEIVPGEPASYQDGGIDILDGPNLGAPAAAGAQVFPGFQPASQVDESRRNLALYLDLEYQASLAWQLQVALRAEDNQDFGSSLDGKIASGYQVQPDLFIRASASTGFRAPSLGQSVFSSIATVQNANNTNELIQAGTFPVQDPVAQALGATPLQAEESKHIALGLRYQPNELGELNIDWYWTEVDNRIALTGNIRPNADRFGQDVVDLMASLGVSQARFFSNTFDTRTTGYDISYQQGFNAGGLQWLAKAAYHRNHTDIIGDIRLPGAFEGIDPIFLFSRAETTRIESAQPSDNMRLELGTEYQNFAFTSRLLKFGSMLLGDSSNNPATDSYYPSEWLLDFEASYTWGNQGKISLGVRNLGDNYPAHPSETGSVFRGENGIFPYSSSAPFGSVGRYFYVSLSYRM